MSVDATMTIRMDENLKKQAEMICDEIGLSVSTVVTNFIKKFVMEKGILKSQELQGEMTNARAMELFNEFSGSIDRDIDYKAELAEGLDEKYANTY